MHLSLLRKTHSLDRGLGHLMADLVAVAAVFDYYRMVFGFVDCHSAECWLRGFASALPLVYSAGH